MSEQQQRPPQHQPQQPGREGQMSPEEKTASHGANKPLGRAGQPVEVAPSYVFLASADASYIKGQVLHPNGGTIVNG